MLMADIKKVKAVRHTTHKKNERKTLLSSYYIIIIINKAFQSFALCKMKIIFSAAPKNRRLKAFLLFSFRTFEKMKKKGMKIWCEKCMKIIYLLAFHISHSPLSRRSIKMNECENEKKKKQFKMRFSWQVREEKKKNKKVLCVKWLKFIASICHTTTKEERKEEKNCKKKKHVPCLTPTTSHPREWEETTSLLLLLPSLYSF